MKEEIAKLQAEISRLEKENLELRNNNEAVATGAVHAKQQITSSPDLGFCIGTLTLLDSLNVGILFSTPDDNIMEVNERYSQWFPIDNMNFHDYNLSKAPWYTEEIESAIKKGQTYHTEFWYKSDWTHSEKGYVTQEGGNNCKYFIYIGKPIFSQDGAYMGYINILEDHTASKILIGELDLAKEKVREVTTMKDSFIASMSHEIRTPLNSIVGFSDILCDSIQDNDDLIEYVNIIKTNNDLLLRIVNDILDLSQIESGKVRVSTSTFNLSDSFHRVFETTQSRNEKENLNISLDIPSTPCYVQLDERRVEQVLMNFTDNALKYTPEGGQITMRYELQDTGIRMEVIDTGIGIDKKHFKRVFNRFEKINDFAQGTGLGLSICKTITEMQGGRVGFDSELGEGSTFWAWFPTDISFNS